MTESDSIEMFRDSARAYLSAADQRQRVRALDDEGGRVDTAAWAQIAELGWLAILPAESDGGLGLGLAEACAIAGEAGRELLPEPLVDAGIQPVALLTALPAGSLRDQLLADAILGQRLLGVAWQERAGDVVPDNAAARVQTLPDGTRLTGRKCYVRPGGGAAGWIVSGHDERGFVLVWVPRSAPGLRVHDEPGIDGSAIATLVADGAHCEVLAAGDAAAEALKQANAITLIAQAAELTGLARRSLELTRDYLQTRQQFGRPIGSFQVLQHRMVDMLIQVELAEACLQECIGLYAPDRASLLASRAKARCASAAVEVTRQAIQLHGAIGTTNECDIGLYFKRAMTLFSRGGHPTLHRRSWSAALRASEVRAVPAVTTPRTHFPTDLDWDQVPEPAFRQMVRELFARYYPEERRWQPYRQTWAQSRDWYLTLSRLGWLAPAWPREYGGLGLPPDKLIAYIEETEAWGVARSPDQGLVMVGPILMRFGTPVQRDRFLPGILSGDHVWTQGYSEPGAGSDLAAVRTEAVLDGDTFVVNGQKTWTTWGADGTHMFMLVRTDKTVKKQAGISFLLVDLKTPGITVRPIRNLADEREFCEVFFDDVRVPRENLVGELNQGWTIAKALLGFERLFTGSPKHTQHTLQQVEKLARRQSLLDDAAFADRYSALQLDTADLGAAYGRYAEMAKRGEAIPPGISMLKIWSTETWERLALLLIDAAGDEAAYRHRRDDPDIDMHVVAPLFNVMGAKIFAGSNEIQRNILAKAVLELPT